MWSEPFVRLPQQVCFSLPETSDILSAVDVAMESTEPGSDEARLARVAQLLITRRLWPELGELLGRQDEEA